MHGSGAIVIIQYVDVLLIQEKSYLVYREQYILPQILVKLLVSSDDLKLDRDPDRRHIRPWSKNKRGTRPYRFG